MVKKLGDMKISKKFTFAFTILTLVSLIVGIVGIVNIFTIKAAGDKLYQEYTQGLEYSGSAAVDYQQLRYSMLKLLYSESSPKNDIDTLLTSMKQSLVDIQNLLDECDRVIVATEYQATLSSIEDNWAKYKDIMNLNIDYVNKGDFKSLAINAKAAGELGTAIRTDFLKLFNDLSQAAHDKAAHNQALAYAAAIAIAAAFIVGTVIAVVLGRYFAAAIGGPINKLAAAAEHLGVGNADVTGILDKKDYELKYRKDEIGVLALAFNKLIAYFKELSTITRQLADGDLTVDVSIKADEDMLGKDLDHLVSSLNELVASIMSSAEQVESGSGMLSGSSSSLSQGATEQASAIEQLTASLATMTEKIQSNAQNAVQASQLSAEAQQHADSGNVLMRDMRGAMDDISDSSNKISKIIKVIDDIAFQTNILALNAAVEAARAGQQGKGFAVVAEEVRTLAAKSASAAKETTEMIETSISKVEAGTLIASRTAQALESIVSQVQDVAKLVNAIAEASQAQAHGLEQISLGVSQVSQVTSTTVATSEETAAASEELAGQSAQLKETVGIFKVKGLGRELSPSSSRQTLRAPGRVSPTSASVRISLDDNDMGKY